jgi:hypothetical protein
MFALRSLCASFFLILCLLSTARAQIARPADVTLPAGQLNAAVTASATAERMRFTAPSNVVRMQLQVISEGGQVVFDVSSKGNVLDWSLQDSSGQRLQGSYLTVVTVKSLSGRVSERIGSISVGEKRIELQRTDAMQMTAGQQQAVGPVEENSGLTVLTAGETEAATIVAHDGTQGQITRSRGALSFRLGDFFSGNDQEQMRLTEEGNLGIGTDKPQAKLDVAGVIRTSKGIEFANPRDGTDGTNGNNVTKLTTTASGSLQQTMANGTVVTNATGTGTQDRLAKWAETGGAGALTDSALTETSGNVGIGTPNPASLLHLAGPSGVSAITLNTPGNQRFRFQTVPAVPNWGALTLNANYNSGWFLDEPATNGWFFKLDTRGGNADGPNNGLWLFKIPPGANPHTDEGPVFGVSSSQAFFAGNVGIGTPGPTAKLDVAGNINTSTQYNIGGSRVLSVLGTNNVFVGVGAGQNNRIGFDNLDSGTNNSFFGNLAGFNNTRGSNNSYFGNNAGFRSSNFTHRNSFFGSGAGANNDNSSDNSFFGYNAGANNTFGQGNAFFGVSAGVSNIRGSDNSFFGIGAGGNTTTTFDAFDNVFFGESDSFFGAISGGNNTSGRSNSFFGASAGLSNTTENNNTFVGSLSNGAAGISNATAIGYRAQVTQSDSLVLGSINGTPNGATADTNVGIGTTAPSARLHVVGDTKLSNNLNVDTNTLFVDATSNRVGIGTNSPNAELGVVGSAGNADFFMRAAGATNGINFGVDGSSPNATLFIAHWDGVNPAQNRIIINPEGTVSISTRAAATATHLCILGSTIADCSSSLRYKERVAPLSAGLDLLSRLRPVSFKWKGREERGLGLIAEEVEQVEPLLVTRNSAGEIQGVRYDQVSVVLINAVREQQSQIKEQRQQLQQKHVRIEKLEARLVALEKVVKNTSMRQSRRRR